MGHGTASLARTQYQRFAFGWRWQISGHAVHGQGPFNRSVVQLRQKCPRVVNQHAAIHPKPASVP